MGHSVGVGFSEGKVVFLTAGYSTFSRMFHECRTESDIPCKDEIRSNCMLSFCFNHALSNLPPPTNVARTILIAMSISYCVETSQSSVFPIRLPSSHPSNGPKYPPFPLC